MEGILTPEQEERRDIFLSHESTISSPFTTLSPTVFGSTPDYSPRRASTYISGISVLLNRKVKGAVYLKLLVNGREFSKLPFKYDPSLDVPLSWNLEPFFTLRDGAELVIQLRRRRRWPKASTIAEASVRYSDIQNYFAGGSDEYRKHVLRNDPTIILDIAPDANPMQNMLDAAVGKAGEVQSVLDHLGKARRFLQTLLQYAVAISELDNISKAVLGCVNLVYKKLKEQDRCDKLVLQLAESMARTLDYIEDVEQFARINQLKKAIEEVRPLMEDTTNFILYFVSRSRATHLFNSSYSQEKLDGLMKRFDIFQQQFDRGLTVQSSVTLETILEMISSGKDDDLLLELKPRGMESRSIIGECMRGTRHDVLAAIDDWVDDLKAPNILWIRGFPGVGKSAIASTVIQRLRSMSRLGSSFIFERAKATTATPNALWRCVAYDLARLYPTVRKVVIVRLDDEEVDVDSSNIKTIFRNLIEAPLLASDDIPIGRLPVIVVDALDECGGQHSRQSMHREGLLSTLKRWGQLPLKFKLIVTSRGEDDIARILTPISELLDLSSGHQVKAQGSEDIRLFLSARFAKIVKGYPDSLPLDWPGSEVINELTNRAAGLFIWAKTLIGFVNEGEPNTQLRQILNGGIGLGDVAILYARVLDASFRIPSPAVLASFQSVAGTIVFAKRPMSRNEFIALLRIEPSMLDFILKGLHSVINEGDDNLQFNHQSFVEFLLDSEKCPKPFRISETTQHQNLTLKALYTMKEKLHFDMCNLPTSHVRNHQVEDLDSRISELITTPLTYACRFWADHLRMVPYEDEIFKEIKTLLQDKLLFWFEVLSLTNEMTFAAPMLKSVLQWCQSGVDEEFDLFLEDALKFIAAFGGVMSQSAPHIYLSALPFTPSRSRVSRQFLSRYPGTLKLQSGKFADWPRILFVIEEHERSVNSVSFSLDGKFIVSGSGDRTVCVWDAETGDLVSSPLDGHTSSVNCVAFSDDGRRVVSCSDDWTVRVWDAESGDAATDSLLGHTNVVSSVAFSHCGRYVISGSHDQTIRIWDIESDVTSRQFTGHSAGVTAIAISSNDKYIASGSFDRTVLIWNIETGEIAHGPFEGHSSWINALAFSPDCTLLASASDDETVQLWSIAIGDIAQEPWEDHTDSVTSIAFSSDGKSLVSGSHDETLRIWDVVSGQVIAGPFRGHTNGVTSVSFSTDGRRILSGSRDETIRVWDAEPKAHEDLSILLEAHRDGVTSVRFTPDGKHVVSGSDDDTVRLWDAETGLEKMKLEGHSSWIETIAISPNGRYAASGSDDQTIRIWDLEAGRLSCPPLCGHRHGITSICFFSDSRRLLSGSYDETLRVWDIETGRIVLGPIEPHSSWITTVAVSPVDTYMASGSYDKTIKIMDTETGSTVVGPLQGHTGVVNCVSFSRTGEYVASASNDKTIRLWNTQTGDLVCQPFVGHNNLVLCLAFSPDNTSIVTGSVDKTVRIWDIDTGEVKLGPLEGHTGSVFSVQYSPDGTKIASGSEDETIRLWDISQGPVVSELANAAPVDFADDSGLQSGWIAGPNSSLLFWVPPWNRSGLWWPRNTAVIAETPTKLDLRSFENGSTWQNCRDPSRT